MKFAIVNFYVILPCMFLQTVPYPTNALRTKHTWHTSTTTCFGTEIPSSGSDYNIDAKANLPIYWQAGRLSVICTCRLYPQECFLGGKGSLKDYVNEKFQLHHRGIEPSNFRLVAQCLNQLRHPVPLYIDRWPSKHILLKSTLESDRVVTILFHPLLYERATDRESEWFQPPTAVRMRFSLFWDFTRSRLVLT